MGYSNRNNLGDSSGSEDDDDDSAKQLRKQKKKIAKNKKNSNPLSHARGKQQKHENIWFRRSQLGYKLFVEYYCNQPIGTISSSISATSSSSNSSKLQEEHGDTSKGGGGDASAAVAVVGGGSRAAKRREKKKRKLQQQNDGEVPSPVAQPPPTSSKTMKGNHNRTLTSSGNNAATDNTLSSNHPLLEAYNKYKTRTRLQGKVDDGISAAICSSRQRSFFEAMSQPLPLTFRFRRRDTSSNNLHFPTEFDHIMKSVPFDSSIYQAIRQTSPPSTSVIVTTKENVGKLYPSFKDWLIEQSTNSTFTIARQEIGSMLPVYILHNMKHIQYGTRMIDMCSSPGSKTLQSLEIICNKSLHKEELGSTSTNSKKPKKPTEKKKVKMGKIVANDVSETRLQTLRDAIERSGIPSKWLDRIIYKCQDASKLQLSNSNSPTKYPYNVILCDVPCSGDATCRKDKHILPMWKPNFGNELHTLQLKILLRALELVSVVNDNSDSGGIVCYSTCSLNPIEDEAVVASAIQQYNAAQEKKKMMLNKSSNRDEDDDDEDCYHVELVEWSETTHNRPKELILHPGITTWKVAEYNDSEITSTASSSVKKGGSSHNDNKRKRTNEQGEDVNIEENEDSDDDDDDKMTRLKWYTSWDDVEDNSSSSQLSKSMFPPLSSESASSTSTTAKLHLERCLRLLPQDQDTGGFFVAILEKKKLSTKMKQ